MTSDPSTTRAGGGDQPPVVPPALRAARSRKAWILLVAVTVGIFAADLASKYWAFANVAPEPVALDPARGAILVPHHQAQVVLPGLLNLYLTTNQGAVFGVGQGKQALFILVSFIAAVIIVRTFWVSHRAAWILHSALGLVLGGALGNLYDRLRYNAVRDMFWLFPETKLPFGLRWPGDPGNDGLYPWIFNLADVALLVGVSVLLICMWRHDRQQRSALSAPGSTPPARPVPGATARPEKTAGPDRPPLQ
jgi:signal peptidase II